MRTRLKLPDRVVDLLGAFVDRNGSLTRLSPLEVSTLSVLAEASPAPVPEQELLRRAWGYRTTNTRTVSMAISRLRKKIEADPNVPAVLLTARGKGYQLILAGPAVLASSPVRPFGRDEDLARAREALAERGCVELIGAGGIGKSTLARSLYPDAVWVDLDAVDAPTGLWRRLAGAFDAESRAAVYRLWGLEGRDVVFDGCEDLSQAATDELGRVLQNAEGPVVMTSRRPLGLAPVVVLGPLDEADALAMIQAVRKNVGLEPVSEDLLEPVLERFGGHPLALELAAPLLELKPAPEHFLRMKLTHWAATLEHILEATAAPLTVAQRAMLAVLSSFALAPTLDTLCDALGRATSDVLHDVHTVRTRGLLTITNWRLAVHPFVRAFAITPAARTTHTAWVARSSVLPVDLGRNHAEIEAALQHATGDELLLVAVRHVLVLDSHGPKDTVLSDIERALAAFPNDPRADVVRGLALLVLDELDAASELFSRAGEHLLSSTPFWRAHAAIGWNFSARMRPDSPGVEEHRAELRTVREAVVDPSLWSYLTLRLAWLEPASAGALRSEILAREGVSFQDRLIARAHGAWSDFATLAELDSVESGLLQAGPESFRIQGWGNLWGFLIRTRAAHGDHAGALERYHALPARFAILEPGDAARQAFLVAVALWPAPQASREVASTLDPEHWWAEVAEWGIDLEGNAPDCPEQDALEAWRDGHRYGGLDTQLAIELGRLRGHTSP